MDPCPFVRILIGNLSLKFPIAAKPSFSGIHPSSSPCYCKIKFADFPTQFSTVHLAGDGQNSDAGFSQSHSLAASFNLNKIQLEKVLAKKKDPVLKIEIFTGRWFPTNCDGGGSAKLIGRVAVQMTGSSLVEPKPCVFQNGWVGIGEKKKGFSSAELFLTVRAEPDPRFVFQFDGEPECSPQVFQVQGSVRQPVFSCKFGLRNERDWDRSRSSMSEPSSTSKSWFSKIRSEDQPAKERKGWSITIHDLSGSPVAIASMVTPFVPSPGSHRVSRSNPGAWLILRPVDGSWRPWGRLEAWRESGGSDSIGYRFELLPATTPAATLASSTISSKNGGKFTIDMTSSVSPTNSPHGSFDFGSGSGSGSRPGSGDFGYLTPYMYRGFVMSSTVKGMKKCSKPDVEVAVQHVTCTEDAAVFVALAAAMDLSMDACRLFCDKLRKELRQ